MFTQSFAQQTTELRILGYPTDMTCISRIGIIQSGGRICQCCLIVSKINLNDKVTGS